MYDRLISHLNKYSILFKHQYGFQARRSTQQAIIEFVDTNTRLEYLLTYLKLLTWLTMKSFRVNWSITELEA